MINENLQKPNRTRFWCLLSFLLLLILIRYALQVNIPRVLFLPIIAFLVLAGDRDEILATCMCCIPMHESIDFFYALVICTVVYVFKCFSHIRIGTNILLLLAVALWEALHCFRPSFSPVDYLSAIIPFVVLAVLMASDADTPDYPFVVRVFAWTTLSMSLVLLIRVLYFSNFNISAALAGLQRLGYDEHSNIQEVAVTGGLVNPNSLGVITVLASTGLMQVRAMKAGKPGDMALMCAMLLFAALGTSRTYLACLALMIVLLLFSEKGGMAKRLRLIVGLTLGIAVTAGVLAVLFPDTFSYFVSRFTSKDITTGRDDLMVRYHRFITGNPKVMFFGIGLQDFGERLTRVYRITDKVPHNSLQEIVLAWGIPGLLLFGAMFLNMLFVSSGRNKNLSLINWIPLLIILFKSLAGQLLTSAYTMLALSFAYLSLSTDLTPPADDVYLPEPKDFQTDPGEYKTFKEET